MVRRLLDAAETLYARTGAGIAQLPPSCRPGIHAARLLYAEIGHEVARRRCDSVANRAVVPAGRKAWLIARALAASAAAQRSPAQPPLAATAFLVESVAATPAPVHAAAAGAARAPRATEGFGDRLVWLLELFERLERSERARGQGAGP